MKMTFLKLCMIVLAAVMVLSACTKNDAGSAGGSSPAGAGEKKKVDLNFTLVVQTKGDQDESVLWNDIVKKYMEKNPNVKINFRMETLPVTDHRTWVTTQLVGGSAPDVFTHRYIWDQEDLQKGLIKDLTPMFKEKNPYAGDKAVEEMFSKTLLKQLGGASQKYASVPTTLDMARIFYNKDLFKKAGIDKVPATWNEFMDAQEKLAKLGVTPFGFPNSKQGDVNYTWAVRMLTEQLLVDKYKDFDTNKDGVIQLNEYTKAVDEGVIDITKPPYKDVYPVLKDWSKYWTKGFNGLDGDSATDMFLRGEVAMVMKFGRDAKKINSSDAKKFELGTFPFPYQTKENNPASGNKLMEIGGVPAGNLAIPAKIDPAKEETAKDFIKFVISPDVQISLAEKMYQTPSVEGVNMPAPLKDFQFIGERMLLNIYGGEVDKNVTDQHHRYGQQFLEGKLSQDDYLAKIKDEMKKGVENYKKTNNWSKENNYGIK